MEHCTNHAWKVVPTVCVNPVGLCVHCENLHKAGVQYIYVNTERVGVS